MMDILDNKTNSKKGWTKLYRIAIVFFVISTFVQIPFTFFTFIYLYHIKNASIDVICQSEKNVKDHFGWSYEGNYQENYDE